MKVTVLVENTTCRQDVIAQHGLSLFIETKHQKILFDMGQDDTFLQNAESLGIDLSKVDIAILSHGHYDHGGGLETFLRINTAAKVYCHAHAFGMHYNGTQKYIGLDQTLRQHPRLILTKGRQKLSENLLLTDCSDLNWQSDSWGLNRREGEVFLPDDFQHEQYLEITEEDKRILISGCSHKGIVNISRHFQPDILIGGFHLNKLERTDKIDEIASELLLADTVYYTGHCTGEKQFDLLCRRMGERLQRISAGLTFEI